MKISFFIHLLKMEIFDASKTTRSNDFGYVEESSEEIYRTMEGWGSLWVTNVSFIPQLRIPWLHFFFFYRMTQLGDTKLVTLIVRHGRQIIGYHKPQILHLVAVIMILSNGSLHRGEFHPKPVAYYDCRQWPNEDR